MDPTPIKVLLVEDNPADADLLRLILGQEGSVSFQLTRVERLGAALHRLQEEPFAVVLLDLSLPDSRGLDTFLQLSQHAAGVPIVVLSGSLDESLAIEAVHAGAQDYLVKGQVNRQLLTRSLRYAMERHRAEEKLKSTATDLERTNLQLRQLAGDLEKKALSEWQAHQDLKKAQSQLVQTEKLASLAQLVAGVAHEINNPLAFVSNNLFILQRDVAGFRELIHLYKKGEALLGETDPELLRRIRDQAEGMDLNYTLENLESLLDRSRIGLLRIRQIVKDLHDFGRYSETEPYEVDLTAGLETIVQVLQERAHKQQIELKAELSPLPQIKCNPAKINQAVLNLMVNAIEACSAGGHVTVSTQFSPSQVHIQVTDDGRGIAPEIRDKVFDPFFTTKAPGQGPGLGLSIAYGIVVEHGGTITLDSAPGQGSRFTITLPIKPEPGPNLQASGPAP